MNIVRVEIYKKHNKDSVKIYVFKTSLGFNELDEIVKREIVNPVSEEYYIGRSNVRESEKEVFYKPGMSDPEAEWILEFLREIYGIDDLRIGQRSKDAVYNPLVHILNPHDDSMLFLSSMNYEFKDTFINLNVGVDKLEEMSIKNTWHLSLEEMKAIKKHYKKKARRPTLIEMETFAQTFSEHCKHKSMTARIIHNGKEVFENLLKETIFKTYEKGRYPWVWLAFSDNAGVVEFDSSVGIAVKVETHNHPSALMPYGGAATGIGGVIRDILGTGKGAKPIASIDVFLVGDFIDSKEVIPPRALLKGLMEGVRDYGNRMGIPTVAGGVYVDRDFLYNPLVFAGSIGIIEKKNIKKHIKAFDDIILLGAKTGIDGIHGATFSSASLSHVSREKDFGAVQIGNPIEEKVVRDFIVEASERELYNAITDCGAGGLSSAIGELAESKGADVYLDRVPLKYSGLSPEEIWISESQERMVIFASPSKREEIFELAKEVNVNAVVIGKLRDDRKLILHYNNHVVGKLDMDFLHNGMDKLTLTSEYVLPEINIINEKVDEIEKDFFRLLSHPMILNKSRIVREYDHEVQARTVTKPLGNDGAVMLIDRKSNKGIAISTGLNPIYYKFDPYGGAMASVDEAYRNLVCLGANPQRIALLDNFAGGRPTNKKELGALVEIAKGLYKASSTLKTPFVSGKDSLYNVFNLKGEIISVPALALITGIGFVEDIAYSKGAKVKNHGNFIVYLGKTQELLSSSLIGYIKSSGSSAAPAFDGNVALSHANIVHTLLKEGIIHSIHDVSEGGLAVALVEMLTGTGFGINVFYDTFSEETYADRLFSEPLSSYIFEVKKDDIDVLKKYTNEFEIIGETTDNGLLELSSDVRIEIKEAERVLNQWELLW